MAKIGVYSYPDTQFGTILKAVEVLIKKFSGHVKEEKMFAETLGHRSKKSGAYLVKMGDMRKYGFIETRAGGIVATHRAKTVIDPLTQDEKKREINKSIMGIGLWKDLHKRIGDEKPPLDDFRIQLTEVTQDRDKAIKEANNIRNLYIDAIAYYNEDVEKTENKSRLNGGLETITEQRRQGVNVPENLIRLQSGEINITVPKKDTHIDYLINMLTDMKTDKETPGSKKQKINP